MCSDFIDTDGDFNGDGMLCYARELVGLALFWLKESLVGCSVFGCAAAGDEPNLGSWMPSLST